MNLQVGDLFVSKTKKDYVLMIAFLHGTCCRVLIISPEDIRYTSMFQFTIQMHYNLIGGLET